MKKPIKLLLFTSTLLCMLLILGLTPTYPVLAEATGKPDSAVQTNDETIKEEVEKKGDMAEPPSGPNVNTDTVTEEVEIDTPASVTGQKIDGTGTVTDFSTSGSKAFYTIKDNEQNIFYLIIDLDKTDNNVYFLSDIKKSDLGESENPKEIASQPPTEQVDSAKTEAPKESGNGFLIAVLLIAVIGVAVYYFLVMKKRHNRGKEQDEDEDEMMDGYEDEDVYNHENENNKDEK
ncbi:CD1107 family mobile element protein [Peribacillus frigoritolerans]|uniref:CD1107 family mobile element protein n=1 Tax=Peribacillus frigoritolerans TaxID=450367 RepID=UPI0039A19BA7